MSDSSSEDRAQDLAAAAANATAAARNYLSIAAEIGEETRRAIARCEEDVREIRGQDRGILDGEHARPYIRNAIELADQTDRGLVATTARIQEMGEYLTSAGTALDVARDSLRELDARGPEWAPPSQVRFLESRIIGLGKAVEEAKPAVDEARVRVARARGNLEPMLYARPEVEARAAAAMAVQIVGDSAERNLRGSMAKVAEVGARLEVAMPSAGLATKEAGGLSDAALAARAASKPGFPEGRGSTPQRSADVRPIRPATSPEATDKRER
jgi:hypothetical protein